MAPPVSSPRRLILAGVALAGVALAAGLLILGGASQVQTELVEPASAETPAPAEEESSDLKPRPRVVEAVAPGQDPQSVPESAAAPAPAGDEEEDGVSPGAASDEDIKRELKALNGSGGGGGRAVMRSDGEAVAPSNAPAEVKMVIQAGNEIAKSPYKWGGGHGQWLDDGYDCSGSVSYALAAGGFVDSPMASGGYERWASNGAGKWITVYANGGHMYMEVAGLRFDTSGKSKLGSRWQTGKRTGGSYAVRHPAGF